MLQNTIQIIQHFMIRISNNFKSQGTQIFFALQVFCSLRFFGMNVAINFNHE